MSNSNKLVFYKGPQILQNNLPAQRVQKQIAKQFRIRSHSMVNPEDKKKQKQAQANFKKAEGNQYNKWYIQPKMRYLKKEENPKSNIKAYQSNQTAIKIYNRVNKLTDDQYVYKNLHNKQFWEWTHPFERPQSKSFAKSHNNLQPYNQQSKQTTLGDLQNRVNIKVLVQFRKKLQQNNLRLPIIVKQTLEAVRQ